MLSCPRMFHVVKVLDPCQSFTTAVMLSLEFAETKSEHVAVVPLKDKPGWMAGALGVTACADSGIALAKTNARKNAKMCFFIFSPPLYNIRSRCTKFGQFIHLFYTFGIIH